MQKNCSIIIDIKRRNSASADGGPRSRVRARGTLCSAPHRHQRKFFGTRVCRVDFTKFPHFPVKIGLIGDIGGSPKYLFYWNLNIFVTQEPLQNLKTVAQTLLGETAHFGFCPPKISFFRGLGGVPKIFFHFWAENFWSEKMLVG